jgi:sigma-B regulation protein RsbU (phosphoserine phosphatase)
MQVIIADDDESQRIYLAGLTRQQGFDPVVFASGESVLDHLGKSDCCLVICDIEMPGMGGLETTKAIRSSNLERYVYVLLVTSRTAAEDFIEGLQAGADDFMAKPVRPAVLRVRLAGAARLIRYDKELRRSRAELERTLALVRDDLEAAAQAQRRLLPPESVSTGPVRASSAFRASGQVSGDMFGYCSLGDGILGLYSADVAGHGVRAGLMAVTLGHMLTPPAFADHIGGQRPWPPNRTFHPARIPTILNERFCDELAVEDYFALTVAIIDAPTGRLSLCQAGQPRPLLIRGDGSSTFLGEGGYPVGLLSSATFDTEDYEIRSGDTLLIYSDGLSEASDPAGLPFGEEGILAAVREAIAVRADLRSYLIAAVERWTRSTILGDDLSLIVVGV